MRLLPALALMLSALVSLATLPSAHAATDLQQALESADKGSDSDYRFRFTGFVCDPATKVCKIVFSLQPRSSAVQEVAGDGFRLTLGQPVHQGTCVLTGAADIEEMLDVKHGLNEKFHNQVDNCMSAAIQEANRQR